MGRLVLFGRAARLRLLWPGALLWLRLLLLRPDLQGGATSPVVAAQSSFNYEALCRYTWEAVDPQKNVSYEINPCGGVDKCNKSSAVCATDIKTNNSFSVGNISLTRNTKLLLEFNTTKPCPQQNGQHLQSSINFYCGKTLGSPEFVASTDCVHYFEWKTYVACKKNLFNPKKEVPCYVYDGLKKHDLNPLIKTSGAYLVDESEDDVELHINICRNIGKSDATRSCPEDAAACLLKDGLALDMGQPKDQLKFERNRLVLTYERKFSNQEEKPDFCHGHNPAVTITFVCPQGRRGEGTYPKLTAESNCRYEIEWVTESACHRDYLESKDCTLTSEQHDIYVNLTPLTQDPGYVSAYLAKDEEEYYYYLNVCGRTTAGNCGNDVNISACQYKPHNQQHKVAGRFTNQTLRHLGDERHTHNSSRTHHKFTSSSKNIYCI